MMDGKGCKNLSLTTFSNILLHFEYNLNIDMLKPETSIYLLD